MNRDRTFQTAKNMARSCAAAVFIVRESLRSWGIRTESPNTDHWEITPAGLEIRRKWSVQHSSGFRVPSSTAKKKEVPSPPASRRPEAPSRRDAGGTIPTTGPQWAFLGAASVVRLPDAAGTSIPVKYAVVDVNRLIPSHDFRAGKPFARHDYPAALQPRDYSSLPEQEKIHRFVRDKAAGLFVSTTEAPMDGPPIWITPGGVVVAGNGRTMALQLAAAKKDYAWYKDFLVKHAADFGLDPAKIGGMDFPVLTRLLPSTVTPESKEARLLAETSNVSFMQSQNVLRRAAGLQSIIDDKVLNTLGTDPEATFSELVSDPVKGRPFREALKKMLPPAEIAAYYGENDMLTPEGRNLVQYILMTKIFPVKVIETMDGNLKRKLEAITPQLIQLRKTGAEVWVKAAVDAVDFGLFLKIEGQTIEDYLQQSGFEFYDKKTISPEARMFYDAFERFGIRDTKEHGKGLRGRLADLARDIQQGGKGSLFGGQEPETPAAMTARVLGVTLRKGAFGAKDEDARMKDEVRQESPKTKVQGKRGDRGTAARRVRIT